MGRLTRSPNIARISLFIRSASSIIKGSVPHKASLKPVPPVK